MLPDRSFEYFRFLGADQLFAAVRGDRVGTLIVREEEEDVRRLGALHSG